MQQIYIVKILETNVEIKKLKKKGEIFGSWKR